MNGNPAAETNILNRKFIIMVQPLGKVIVWYVKIQSAQSILQPMGGVVGSAENWRINNKGRTQLI